MSNCKQCVGHADSLYMSICYCAHRGVVSEHHPPKEPGPESSSLPSSSELSTTAASSCSFLFLGVGFSHLAFSSVNPPPFFVFSFAFPLLISCCLGVVGAEAMAPFFWPLGAGVAAALLDCYVFESKTIGNKCGVVYMVEEVVAL